VFQPKPPQLRPSENDKIEDGVLQKLIIGSYTFIKTLGKGKYSVVKLAKHIHSGEKVCSANRCTVYGGCTVVSAILNRRSL
jgi:serine/threonine protein kinase